MLASVTQSTVPTIPRADYASLQTKSRHVDKALAFLAVFCGFQADEREQEAEKLVDDLVWDVLEFVSAVDKTVRIRACQLLLLILSQLSELDAQLSDRLQETWLARLRDKQPAVRALAATSVARLANAQEVRAAGCSPAASLIQVSSCSSSDVVQDGSYEGDPVMTALLQLLASDKNKVTAAHAAESG